VGRRLPTKHNIYVDDNLLAKVRAYMHLALASGFEATFTIMGHPCPSLRPVAVALDKLKELEVSSSQILLGLLINTREMTVTILDEFSSKVLSLLTPLGTAAGRVSSQGPRIASRQARTYRPSLSPILLPYVTSLLIPCLRITRDSSLPCQHFQALPCTNKKDKAR